MKIHDYVVANGWSHPTGMGGWGNIWKGDGWSDYYYLKRSVLCDTDGKYGGIISSIGQSSGGGGSGVIVIVSIPQAAYAACSSSTIDREE